MFYSLVLVPVDALALLLAGFATWYLRFRVEVPGLREAGQVLSPEQLLRALFWIVPLFLVVFAVAGLYAAYRERRFLDEVFRVLLAVSTGTLAIIVALFFRQAADTSRFVVLAGWVLTIVTVTLGRYIVRAVERWQRTRGVGVHRVVLIGGNETGRRLRTVFREHPEMGVRVVATLAGHDIDHLLRELERVVAGHHPHEVIETEHSMPQEDSERLLDFCDEHRLQFKFTPNTFETQATNVGIATISGIPIVELKATPLEGWGRVGKRVADIVGAGTGIVVLSPVLLALALAVKLGSRGPIFYKDNRVDRDRVFKLLKFRSMYDNVDHMRKELMALNERTGPMFKIKNDPRVTPVGRFIRKTSLDELGQLFNVIRGDMSLVGPRPHRPDEIAQYERHHKKLLRIKPGITGLAATSGRSDLDFEEEVRLDTYYIEHWSLLLDLKIMLRTIPVVLSRKSAA